jgi:transposase
MKALAAPPYNIKRYRPDTAPFISNANKTARLEFATKWKDYEAWDNAIWTDECSFTTTLQGRQPVLRQPGERLQADTTQWRHRSGRLSIMVWGALGYDFKSELVIIERIPGRKGMGAKAYEEQILWPHLGPLFAVARANRPDCFVVEDNAPPHAKKGANSCTNNARSAMGIYSIDWPPQSPDLNVSEKGWKRLKQKVRSSRPIFGWTSREALVEFLLATWDNMKPEDYRHHIDEMPQKLERVRERRGGQTNM